MLADGLRRLFTGVLKSAERTVLAAMSNDELDRWLDAHRGREPRPIATGR
jgi:hypothetical protein